MPRSLLICVLIVLHRVSVILLIIIDFEINKLKKIKCN